MLRSHRCIGSMKNRIEPTAPLLLLGRLPLVRVLHGLDRNELLKLRLTEAWLVGVVSEACQEHLALRSFKFDRDSEWIMSGVPRPNVTHQAIRSCGRIFGRGCRSFECCGGIEHVSAIKEFVKCTAKNLTELDVSWSDITNHGMIELCSLAPKLVKLKAYGCHRLHAGPYSLDDYPVGDFYTGTQRDVAAAIGEMCPLLEQVTLSKPAATDRHSRMVSPAETWAVHFPRLKVLDMGSGYVEYPVHVPTVLKTIAACTAVKELDCPGVLPGDTLLQLTRPLSAGLTTIRLTQCEIAMSSLIEAARNCVCLEEIVFPEVPPTAEECRLLAEACPQLQRVDVSDANLTAISVLCRALSLTQLDFQIYGAAHQHSLGIEAAELEDSLGQGSPFSELVEELTGSRSAATLTRLKLYYVPGISGPAILDAAEGLTSLTHLEWEGEWPELLVKRKMAESNGIWDGADWESEISESNSILEARGGAVKVNVVDGTDDIQYCNYTEDMETKQYGSTPEIEYAESICIFCGVNHPKAPLTNSSLAALARSEELSSMPDMSDGCGGQVYRYDPSKRICANCMKLYTTITETFVSQIQHSKSIEECIERRATADKYWEKFTNHKTDNNCNDPHKLKWYEYRGPADARLLPECIERFGAEQERARAQAEKELYAMLDAEGEGGASKKSKKAKKSKKKASARKPAVTVEPDAPHPTSDAPQSAEVKHTKNRANSSKQPKTASSEKSGSKKLQNEQAGNTALEAAIRAADLQQLVLSLEQYSDVAEPNLVSQARVLRNNLRQKERKLRRQATKAQQVESCAPGLGMLDDQCTDVSVLSKQVGPFGTNPVELEELVSMQEGNRLQVDRLVSMQEEIDRLQVDSHGEGASKKHCPAAAANKSQSVPSTAPAARGGLFGASPAAGGLFGASPAAEGGGLFGGAVGGGGGLFGAWAAAAEGGLFGGAATTSAAAASPAAAEMFGAATGAALEKDLRQARRERASPAAAPEPEPEPEEDENKLCAVCMSELKQMALIPCGHVCLCPTCVDIILEKTKECPICRSPTQGAMKVFF